MKNYIILGLCCLYGSLAWGQKFQFRQYTTADGLGHNQVFDILQDKKGFIWLGTDNGLFRFDGLEFYDMRQVDTLLGGSITLLEYDPQKGFWAGRYKRHIRYLVESKPLVGDSAYYRFPAGSDLIHAENFYFSTVGATVYGVNDTGKVMHNFREQFLNMMTELPDKDLRASFLQYRLFQDHQNRILLGNQLGVVEFRERSVYPLFPELGQKSVFCFAENQDNRLFLGSLGQVFIYYKDQQESILSHPDWTEKRINFIREDHKGRIWISVMEAGVYLYTPLDQEIQFIGDRIGMGTTYANNIFQDRNQQIWLATNTQGVFQVQEHNIQTIEIPDLGAPINKLGLDPKGQLLVGSGSQLFRQRGPDFAPILPYELEGRVTRIQTVDQAVYVSIFPRNVGDERFRSHKIGEELYTLTGMYSYFFSPDSLITWSSAWNYKEAFRNSTAQTYVRAPDKAFEMVHIFKEPNLIQRRLFWTKGLVPIPQKGFWLARDDGLFLWDYPNDFPREAVLRLNLTDLILQKDSILWSTTEQGIYRLVLDSSRRVIQSSSRFLAGIQCFAVCLDENENVWVGTERGLCQIEGESVQFINHSLDEYHQPITELLYDRQKGRLWAAAGKEVFFLEPEEWNLKTREHIQVYITTVSHPDSMIQFPDQLALSSRQNDLNIRFSGLLFSPTDQNQKGHTPFLLDPGQFTYQYRLNDRPWRKTQNRQVEFAALADGDYLFEVRASLDGEQWGPSQSLRFFISPPFWKSPLFYSILSGLFVLLVAFISWRQIRQVKKREREKRLLQKRMTELEQQAQGALMNPHFIFNTLNSIQHFFNQNDSADANEFLAGFAQLIRLNMEVIQKGHTSLDEELERLTLYLELEQMRFQDKLEYRLLIDPEIDPEEIMLPSMLIQPFVENAIWHGISHQTENGWVHIHLDLIEEEFLRIRIEDNGPGVFSSQFAKKSAHTSRGIDITRSRLYHYSPTAQLTLEEKRNEAGEINGTLVEIRLPV